MTFNNLVSGSQLYILKRGEDIPELVVGSIKKVEPQQPYQATVPMAFQGINQQALYTITVSVKGTDEVYKDVPGNIEIASKGNITFTGNKEQMLQVVDSMILTSKQALDKVPYHQNVISVGDSMLEVLNPRYAVEKQHDRTIKELELKQAQTDSKLDQILQALQTLTNK